MIEIKYIHTNLLQTHDRNPRKIEGGQFEILKKSVKDNPEYFQVRPILATPDLVVFAGNMRLLAARDLGLDQVPVAILDVPPAKQRELMIRDNVQNGKWDVDILGADFGIEELQAWGCDPMGFGFDAKEKESNAGGKATEDDDQKWVYTCESCGVKKVFTKSDLKPYDSSSPDF